MLRRALPAIGVAAALVAGPGPGTAADITTAEMGNAAAALPDRRCRDIVTIMQTMGMESRRDTMTMIALIVFLDGFAAGTGTDRDAATRKIVNKCLDHPSLPLRQAIDQAD